MLSFMHSLCFFLLAPFIQAFPQDPAQQNAIDHYAPSPPGPLKRDISASDVVYDDTKPQNVDRVECNDLGCQNVRSGPYAAANTTTQAITSLPAATAPIGVYVSQASVVYPAQTGGPSGTVKVPTPYTPNGEGGSRPGGVGGTPPGFTGPRIKRGDVARVLARVPLARRADIARQLAEARKRREMVVP